MSNVCWFLLRERNKLDFKSFTHIICLLFLLWMYEIEMDGNILVGVQHAA